MGLLHTLVGLVFVCLALMGASHAREWIPDEVYWQAVWPNTQIPSSIKELLNQDAEAEKVAVKQIGIQNPETIFLDHDLYPGKTMTLRFNSYTQPIGFLPLYAKGDIKEIEEKFKGLSGDEVCTMKQPIHGEHSFCSKLGKNIRPLSSTFADKQNQYTIEGAQNLGDNAIMCHRVNSQEVVFYCHQIHETTAYMVPMVAADGTKTKALAVCHLETSEMNAQILYELLKVKPGEATVCHFLENRAIMWLPNLPQDNAYNIHMASLVKSMHEFVTLCYCVKNK